MTYKLLVSGGRDFDDVDFIVEHLSNLHLSKKITTLVNGGAKGVDTIARMWAEEVGGIEIKNYPVTDSDWKRLGKSAGIQRNSEMLEKEKPDGVFCFPGGKGTEDMFNRAYHNNIELWKSEKVLFRKEDPTFGFMSNFTTGYDFVDPKSGEWWPTTEHYYQAGKTPVEKQRGRIQCAATPAEARRLGRECNHYSDWGNRKIDVMRRALKLKFSPGSKAAEKLLDTGKSYLVEYAPWGDVFWGIDKDHYGENWLGRLLMERRSQLA